MNKNLGGIKILRRHKGLYIILIFILILSITGCRGKIKQSPTLIVDDYNGINLDEIDHYKIEVDFDPISKSYTANQRVTYVNNTGEELEDVYFHIYPNAYRSIETAPILFDMTTVSKEEYEAGDMEIEEVKIDKREMDFKIEGVGGTILKLELETPLQPSEKTEIDFKYDVKLPLNIDRFGYGEDVFNFGNWYPIACVYDDTGWNLDPYYSIGDPFYSTVSNYDITIKTTKDMEIASTGNIISKKTKGKKRIYNIESRLTRDFAWVASPKFSVKELEIDGTMVKLYFMEDKPNMVDFAIGVGIDSMEIFNRIFGKYPYGQYSIVMTEFPTGMEYPGIVFINKDYFSSHYREALEQVIVHETAHQWWYGIVGNDQIDEAWLDEALASYSEVIYMANRYGEKRGEDYYDYNFQTPYDYGKEYLATNGIVNKPLDQFEGWEDYGLLVYVKGAVFLNEIKEEFGMETLYDILNKYYSMYRFYNGTTENFIKVCQEITNTSFSEKVDKWLYGR